MVAQALSPSYVAAFVGDVVEKLGPDKSRFIGLRARPEWSGPASIPVTEDLAATVVPCPSPLDFLAALVEHADAPGPIVLLTEGGLPEEAYARLAKRMLLSPNAWDVAKSLFGARDLDPSLRSEAWIAEALVEAAPPGGFERSTTSVLDEARAWAALLRHRVGLIESSPSLEGLLAWAADGTGPRSLAAEPDTWRERIGDRIRAVAGPAGRAILLTAARDGGRDVIPIGLALDVLFHPSAADGHSHARGKFEGARIVGGPEFEAEDARAWADAALGHVREALRDAGARPQAEAWCARAEELLAEAGAAELARLSDVLRGGLELRLATFARSLDTEGPADGLEAALESIRFHAATDESSALFRALEMATRLARWTRGREAPDAATSLADAVERYAAGSAFVDRARREVAEHVEDKHVGAALAKLLAAVDDWRERENERFGSLVAAEAGTWTSSSAVVPVERVLADVVAPVAKDHPILLLVMDGMSVDVFQEILESCREGGWEEWSPKSAPAARRWVLAAFPTVTRVCRTSLFAGRVTDGTAADERKAFAAHPELGGAVLVHKGDLEPGADDADDYLSRIASSDTHVVGVVLNVVDDHLGAGGQFRHQWGRATIKRLDRILDAAQGAGRVVVLTSDHGHALGRTTAKTGVEEHGERYRLGADAGAGEIVVQGPRVRAAGSDAVVLPWSERIRYGSKKHGFHGGASPQEVVVPLALLRYPEYEAAWLGLPPERPKWWDLGAEVTPDVVVPGPELVVTKPKPRRGQGRLFDAPAAWIERCLESERYEESRRVAGRRVPSTERIRKILVALDAQGGQATRRALATALGLPELRLRGTLPVLQRVLNVDGYAVLDVDEESGTVRLDRGLLESQFGED